MEHVHISTNWQELFSFLDDMLPTASPELYKNGVGVKFWVGQRAPDKSIEISHMSLSEDFEVEWVTWCYCDPDTVPEVLAFYQQEQVKKGDIGEIVIES